MLKKITGVILTMSVLFSVFLTTPAYAATKKVANGLKEVTGVTLTRKEYPEEDPIDEDVTFIDPDAYVFNFVFDKHGKELYWFARIDMYNMDQVQDIFVIDVATKKVVDTLRLVREEYGFNIESSVNGRYASVLTENGPAIYDIKTKKFHPTDYQYDFISELTDQPFALVSIYGDRKLSRILDLNSFKLLPNDYYGNNVIKLNLILDSRNNYVGLSALRSDGTATLDRLDKGRTRIELKNVDSNADFYVDGDYIIESIGYPVEKGTKVYDYKTGKLLATSPYSVGYIPKLNLFDVWTTSSSNYNGKVFLYNTEGKKIGDFDYVVNQNFFEISNENSLKKTLIMYGNMYNDSLTKCYEVLYS